eukprot:Skav231092  [mRNA]  locus=scaffold524:574555:575505:- [translate_table: standard]
MQQKLETLRRINAPSSIVKIDSDILMHLEELKTKHENYLFQKNKDNMLQVVLNDADVEGRRGCLYLKYQNIDQTAYMLFYYTEKHTFQDVSDTLLDKLNINVGFGDDCDYRFLCKRSYIALYEGIFSLMADTDGIIQLIPAMVGGAKKTSVKKTVSKTQKMDAYKTSVEETAKSMPLDKMAHIPNFQTIKDKMDAFARLMETDPVNAIERTVLYLEVAEIDKVLECVKGHAGGSTERKLSSASVILFGLSDARAMVSNIDTLCALATDVLAYAVMKSSEASVTTNLTKLKEALERIKNQKIGASSASGNGGMDTDL